MGLIFHGLVSKGQFVVKIFVDDSMCNDSAYNQKKATPIKTVLDQRLMFSCGLFYRCYCMTNMFRVEAMVRGYHCYQDIWQAIVGEELQTTRELGNIHDLYAVAVTRSRVTVGRPSSQKDFISLFSLLAAWRRNILYSHWY